MNRRLVSKVYDNYARIYNILYGQVLDAGRNKAIEMMEISFQNKILEIGIGTGLSLKKYPNGKDIEITGIDLSEKMLSKAKIQAQRLSGMKIDIKLMDGEQTAFPSGFFDKVVLMYVYSVTPNPKELMKEVKRICKPLGDIYLVNHFSHSKENELSFFERAVSSFSEKIGFRSDFSYQKYVSDLKMQIVTLENANIFSLTKVIHLKNVTAKCSNDKVK
ncbi:MAG: class I SAM-dependent methyltransferase [Cyclobacteriaceae bacterium]